MDQTELEALIAKLRGQAGFQAPPPPVPSVDQQEITRDQERQPWADAEKYYPEIPAPQENTKALEDMIVSQRRAAGMGAFEKGMNNATKSILTTGAAIRLGANPVPDSQPTGLGEGMERNAMMRNKQADTTYGNSLKIWDQKVRNQEAQKQRDLEAAIAREQMASREKIASMEQGQSRYNNPVTAGRLDLERQKFEASKDPAYLRNQFTERATSVREGTLANQNEMQPFRKMDSYGREVTRNRLPHADESKITGIMDGLARIDSIRERLDTIRDNVGPIKGRISELLVRAGFADGPTAETSADLAILLGKTVKSITGAQAAVPELVTYAKANPQWKDNAEAFVALLDHAEEMMKKEASNIFAVGAGGGRNLSGYQRTTGLGQDVPMRQSPTIGASGVKPMGQAKNAPILMIRPDGVEEAVEDEYEAQEAEKASPPWRRK